ncbi:YbaK/EbsC family protein [Nonomuraea dietziae]|uniref:YbaK/EbsC family protein n=1 Tax=Nonomuraea dietziae TaxID=65515 RepID=UPI0033DB265A
MDLRWMPALDRMDLLAEPVARAVREMKEEVRVAEIDAELADTAAFCDRYGVAMDASANCVVVAGRRGGEVRYAACMVLATTRADVNGVIRRHLDARKISFASMDDAVSLTGMEYGGITPLGLPEGWPILVDSRVAAHPEVVIGSGVRRSKLALPGAALAGLKTAEVLDLAN